MCGRYAYYYLRNQLEQILGTGPEPDDEPEPEIGTSYNVAPTQEAPVLVKEGERSRLVRKRWGLVPGWAKDPSVGVMMFNARSETLREKPAFREAFEKRRCLVPISGFYEWQALKELKRKKPWFVAPDDGTVMLLAGLWEEWGSGEHAITTFSIVTTESRGRIAELHERSPVMLRGDQWSVWLTGEPELAMALCEPRRQESLSFTPVSSRVGNVRNNDPTLLQRAEHEAGEQMGLF